MLARCLTAGGADAQFLGVRALRVLQERSAAAVRERVSSALSERAGAGALAVVQAAFDAADAEAARTLRTGSEANLACAPGCASCCHVHVEATSAELDAAADHLFATRSKTELADLSERLGRGAGLSAEERWNARLPCAFLASDSTCSIHVVRPLRCRAFHSYEAQACRDAFAGHTQTEPPRSAALERVYGAVEEALDRVLESDRREAPELLEEGVRRRIISSAQG